MTPLASPFATAPLAHGGLQAFKRHGLRKEDIIEVRISRWGHAMILPKLGQIADGTLARASAPPPGLWFAYTDVQGAPPFENALAASFNAADAVNAYLDRTASTAVAHMEASVC